jgi:hypothetical protein
MNAIRSRRAAVAPGGDDPILAVIAKHRAAVEEWNRAVAIWAPMNPVEDPNYEAADADVVECLTQVDLALWEVLTVQPTTLPGVIALLHHAGQSEMLREHGRRGRETVISTCMNSTGSLKRAAQDFPIRIAKTMGGLIKGGAR